MHLNHFHPFHHFHPDARGVPTTDFVNLLLIMLGVLLALLFYSSKLS